MASQFRITAKMKQIAFVVVAVLSVSVLGCKPDAAVKQGAVIDSDSSAPETRTRRPDTPVVIKPKTDKESSVTPVQ